MGLAGRLFLQCCIEGQVRHTAEIEVYVPLSINQSEQYVPTKRAPGYEAGALHV